MNVPFDTSSKLEQFLTIGDREDPNDCSLRMKKTYAALCNLKSVEQQ